jgi:hypothetical protein
VAPLPEFNAAGDLPAGIYQVPLTEILHRFGEGTAQRQALADRLQRIHRLADQTGHVARFVVFGSFITAEPSPHDVDVFLLMEDTFEAGEIHGETAILFNHSWAQAYFGASVFWLRRLAALGGEAAAIEHWQIKRDGTRRGIVEVIRHDP